MAKYVDHPYMERYINGKISKNLKEVVALIDDGEADILEESLSKSDHKKAKHRKSTSVTRRTKTKSTTNTKTTKSTGTVS